MLWLPLAALALLLLPAGCGGEIPEEEVVPGDVVEKVEALCKSASSKQKVAPCRSTTIASSSRNYGAGSGCGGYFAADFSGTRGQNFTISGAWGEALPKTEQSCPFALATVKAYKYVKTGWRCYSGGRCYAKFAWKYLGTQYMQGKWHKCNPGDFFCNTGCYMEPSGGTTLSQHNSKAYKIRVEVKAIGYWLFGASPMKARATIHHHGPAYCGPK